MERTESKNRVGQTLFKGVNALLVKSVLGAAYSAGVEEFCVCPGSRNSPFVMALEKQANVFYWPEERSAAFFALGRCRGRERPVAVITTSGTAVGEMLPAAMEAYYSGVPLLLITADRPRSYRGTGAPQTAEQVGIYGPYVTYSQDLSNEEQCYLSLWDQRGPAHLNVCFDEPLIDVVCSEKFSSSQPKITPRIGEPSILDHFFQKVDRPLIVVSTLAKQDRSAVLDFLLKVKAPVYLEATSGLREEKRLQSLRLFQPEKNFDAVLRIGGVPTTRLWRDLEDLENQVEVLSIAPVPFSGLSWGKMITTDLAPFFSSYSVKRTYTPLESKKLPFSSKEEELIHRLSLLIPEHSLVYLGNSLPIRHWDRAAGLKPFEVFANRGVNGIDGQISTFLGLCEPDRENWAVIGDLTAVYDLAAPWIIPQLAAKKIALVVVNNGGGQIFKKMYASEVFLNSHDLSFEHLAKFWRLDYKRWTEIPAAYELKGPTLIELKVGV